MVGQRQDPPAWFDNSAEMYPPSISEEWVSAAPNMVGQSRNPCEAPTGLAALQEQKALSAPCSYQKGSLYPTV